MLMTAVILYDSFTLASKANTMLQRASANAENSLEWKIIPWRTEMLRSRVFVDPSLQEAANAPLIICAWNDSRPFQHWVERWLEEWNACRAVDDAAIAILGEHDEAGWNSAAVELARFADAHQLHLIAGQRTPADKNQALETPSPVLANVSRPAFPQPLARPWDNR